MQRRKLAAVAAVGLFLWSRRASASDLVEQAQNGEDAGGGGNIQYGGTCPYTPSASRPYGHFGTSLPPGLPSNARKAGAGGSAKACLTATLSSASPDFAKCVMGLARHESGITFGLPAVTFSFVSGKSIITSWGVFQFNAGAWRALANSYKMLKGVPEQNYTKYPWEASPEEEIKRPVARFLDIWNNTSGDAKTKAYSVYMYFMAPGYWSNWMRGKAPPTKYHNLALSRLREAGF